MNRRLTTEKIKDEMGRTKTIKLKKDNKTFMKLDKARLKDALSKVDFFQNDADMPPQEQKEDKTE